MTDYYTYSSPYAYAKIMRGYECLCSVFARRSKKIAAAIPASGSVSVVLKAGERVHVEHAGGTLFSNSRLHTQLVGFLVHKSK